MDAEEYNKLKEDRKEKIDQAEVAFEGGHRKVGLRVLMNAVQLGKKLLEELFRCS